MKKEKQDKMIPYKKQGIFDKIKAFFSNLYNKKDSINNVSEIDISTDNSNLEIVDIATTNNQTNSSFNSNNQKTSDITSTLDSYIKVDTKQVDLYNYKLKLDSDFISVDDIPEELVLDLELLYIKENDNLKREIIELTSKINN